MRFPIFLTIIGNDNTEIELGGSLIMLLFFCILGMCLTLFCFSILSPEEMDAYCYLIVFSNTITYAYGMKSVINDPYLLIICIITFLLLFITLLAMIHYHNNAILNTLAIIDLAITLFYALIGINNWPSGQGIFY